MSTPEIYWLFLACLFHTIIWFLGLKIADVVKDGGSPSSAFTCFSTTKVIQLPRTKNIQAKKALLSLPSSIPLFTPFTVHQNAFCHQKPGHGQSSHRSMEAFEDLEERETYFNNDEDVEKERGDVHQYFAQGGSDRVVAVKQINKVYGSKVKK